MTKKSKSLYNSRDADNEIHLILVADAGQICVHTPTFFTSITLTSLHCRRVEATVGAAVVMPAGSTGTTWSEHPLFTVKYM